MRLFSLVHLLVLLDIFITLHCKIKRDQSAQKMMQKVSASMFMCYSFRNTDFFVFLGVPGLRNLGSTCYANSLLQGLAASKYFCDWIFRLVDLKRSRCSELNSGANGSSTNDSSAKPDDSFIEELSAILQRKIVHV